MGKILSAFLLSLLSVSLSAADAPEGVTPEAEESALISLLKGVALKPVFLQSAAGDGTSVFGLQYDINRSKSRSVAETWGAWGADTILSAKGTITRNAAQNSQNFSKFGGSFNGFLHYGSADQTPEDKAEIKRLKKLSRSQPTSPNKYDDQIELIMSHAGTTSLYCPFGAAGGMEANQDFNVKQGYFGVQTGLAISEGKPDSSLRYANLFDWPFAIFRWFDGTQDGISPNPFVWPSIVLGLDRLLPQDAASKFLDGGEQVTRFQGEIDFKTRLSDSLKSNFEANWRYQQLLGTAQPYDQAYFSYFTATLSLDNGFFLSYADGRLPLDAKPASTLNLGLVVKFD
jgi:hypothetical protein